MADLQANAALQSIDNNLKLERSPASRWLWPTLAVVNFLAVAGSLPILLLLLSGERFQYKYVLDGVPTNAPGINLTFAGTFAVGAALVLISCTSQWLIIKRYFRPLSWGTLAIQTCIPYLFVLMGLKTATFVRYFLLSALSMGSGSDRIVSSNGDRGEILITTIAYALVTGVALGALIAYFLEEHLGKISLDARGWKWYLICIVAGILTQVVSTSTSFALDPLAHLTYGVSLSYGWVVMLACWGLVVGYVLRP